MVLTLSRQFVTLTGTGKAVRVFFFFLQGKAPKEIHAILTETLACFLPGRAKDLSASLYRMAVGVLSAVLKKNCQAVKIN